MVERWRMQSLPAVGWVVALAYGLTGEIFFQQASDLLIGTLSISFLFLLPMGIGALTVALASESWRSSWSYAVFAPWVACGLLGVAVLILAMEAWICVAMGLPIFFVMSSLGGVLMRWWFTRKQGGGHSSFLGMLLLMPLLFSPLEAQWQSPTIVREVKSAVLVAAPAEVVWAEFVTVPKIQPEEEHFAWFQAAGLPHPVEARLDQPGIDGVRYASYDNGMKVIEPVQVWELYERYRFGVLLDHENSQRTPLWSDVAGEHLQVEWVEYQIEPISSELVRLHLTSRYALATPVNLYASAWVDFLLSDFQYYILDVVTGRAQRAGILHQDRQRRSPYR
jgi:hypothetical protein